MDYTAITKDERARLRELAKKQKEIASLPIMQTRMKKWYDLNDGKTEHPLVTFEFDGPLEEVYERSKSASGLVRDIENQLIFNITNHTLLNDDRVIPDYVSLHPANWIQRYDIKLETYGATDVNGNKSMGYMFVHPINDLEEDFHKLKKSVYHVDVNLEDAKKRQAIINEAIGDILPAKIEFPSLVFGITDMLVHLMGMENTFYAIYDYPELIHKAASMLTDDYLEYIRALEEGYAMLPNNDGSFVNQGSWGYTHSLPSANEIQDKVKAKHVWGYTESQETVSKQKKLRPKWKYREYPE